MLKTLSLSFTESGFIKLKSSGVTLLIGTNGSGKSYILRNIANRIAKKGEAKEILVSMKFNYPNRNDVIELFKDRKSIVQKGQLGDELNYLKITPNPIGTWTTINFSLIDRFHSSPTGSQDWERFYDAIFREQILFLNAAKRIEYCSPQQCLDLISVSPTPLGFLFDNNEVFERIRQEILVSFGKYISIDFFLAGFLRFRISDQRNVADERTMSDENRRYFASADLIENVSDGI